MHLVPALLLVVVHLRDVVADDAHGTPATRPRMWSWSERDAAPAAH
jgi:hypothetical protein